MQIEACLSSDWLEDRGRAWKHGSHYCYARTGRLSQREVSLSGVGSGLSALATCDADMW